MLLTARAAAVTQAHLYEPHTAHHGDILALNSARGCKHTERSQAITKATLHALRAHCRTICDDNPLLTRAQKWASKAAMPPIVSYIGEVSRAHPAGMGDLELLDELEGTQSLTQIGLVGGRHDGCHAC